jgi:hypothetical protein
MRALLDELRAIAQTAAHSQGNEKNERNEKTPPATPFAPLNSFNSFLSSPETDQRDDLEERAALIEHGAEVPKRWAEGFAVMSAMPAPAGFSARRWQRIVDATGSFLDRWANEAVQCGWSDLDVFGCNPDRPDARFDCMGLVTLLDRAEVIALDHEGATLKTQIGSQLRYRRRPLPTGTVSLWDLRFAGR